jgi:hypothetical protein
VQLLPATLRPAVALQMQQQMNTRGTLNVVSAGVVRFDTMHLQLAVKQDQIAAGDATRMQGMQCLLYLL